MENGYQSLFKLFKVIQVFIPRREERKHAPFAKYSPGHFYGEVFDPQAKNWLHFNSILERRGARFTLKPLLKKKKRVSMIEGLIPDARYVHYVRIE